MPHYSSASASRPAYRGKLKRPNAISDDADRQSLLRAAVLERNVTLVYSLLQSSVDPYCLGYRPDAPWHDDNGEPNPGQFGAGVNSYGIGYRPDAPWHDDNGEPNPGQFGAGVIPYGIGYRPDVPVRANGTVAPSLNDAICLAIRLILGVHSSCEAAELDILEPFLDARLNISLDLPRCRGMTPLQVAVQLQEPSVVPEPQLYLQRRNAIVERLLEASASPDAVCSLTELRQGSCFTDVPALMSVVRTRLEKDGVDFNSTEADVELITALVRHGANINVLLPITIRSQTKIFTPLCAAYYLFRADLIEPLIRLGADPLIKCDSNDNRGLTLTAEHPSARLDCQRWPIEKASCPFSLPEALVWCDWLVSSLRMHTDRRILRAPDSDRSAAAVPTYAVVGGRYSPVYDPPAQAGGQLTGSGKLSKMVVAGYFTSTRASKNRKYGTVQMPLCAVPQIIPDGDGGTGVALLFSDHEGLDALQRVIDAFNMRTTPALLAFNTSMSWLTASAPLPALRATLNMAHDEFIHDVGLAPAELAAMLEAGVVEGTGRWAFHSPILRLTQPIDPVTRNVAEPAVYPDRRFPAYNITIARGIPVLKVLPPN